MPSRPLPPPPRSLPCASCEGFYALEYDSFGTPTAYHSSPYCAAFDAISTSVHAIEHYEKCRAKKAPDP